MKHVYLNVVEECSRLHCTVLYDGEEFEVTIPPFVVPCSLSGESLSALVLNGCISYRSTHVGSKLRYPPACTYSTAIEALTLDEESVVEWAFKGVIKGLRKDLISIDPDVSRPLGSLAVRIVSRAVEAWALSVVEEFQDITP